MRLFFEICAALAALAAVLFIVIPQFSATDAIIALAAMFACLVAAEFSPNQTRHVG